MIYRSIKTVVGSVRWTHSLTQEYSCREKATPGSRDPAARGGSGKRFFPLRWLKQGGGIAEVNILYCLCKLPLENTSPRCFLDVFVANELPIPFSVARRQGSADTSFRPLFCISSVSLFFWFVSGFAVSSG